MRLARDREIELLATDEVIAVPQTGSVAPPVSGDARSAQVWAARNQDGSVTVALFNRGDETPTVLALWKDLGLINGQLEAPLAPPACCA